MSKEQNVVDDKSNADVIASGSIWEARVPKNDGTRKHAVVTSASRTFVSTKDPANGAVKRMPRWRFKVTYRPSNGKSDSGSLWGEAQADAGATAFGPEMRKLKKALDAQPRSSIVNISYDLTPALATELVATAQGNNRQSSNVRVNAYGRDQSGDQWVETHQGIAVGPCLQLGDGEHRCRSVMSTGTTVRVQVSQYTSQDHFDAARKHMDGQYTRTKAHVLEIDSLVERGKGKAVASTIDAMRLIDARIEKYMTKAELIEAFKQRKVSIAAIHSRADKRYLSGPRAALVIAHMRAPEKIEELVTTVTTMVGIEPRSAAQVLARRLDRLQENGAEATVRDAALFTLAIAYLHVKGLKPTKSSKSRHGGGTVETPQINKAIKFFLGDNYRAPTVEPESVRKSGRKAA